MLVAVLPAQSLFPLSDVEAGMKAVGRTVFAGSTIEEFDVEILGVLENVGPKQSLIIGRLSGGPLEKTGVMAGMSGSPVYIDGRLAGAVAFSFPFSTEPLAGIRPIEQMVAGFDEQDRAAQVVPLDMLADLRRVVGIERPLQNRSVVEPQFLPIATPVSLAGFSGRTAQVFGDQLRSSRSASKRKHYDGSAAQAKVRCWSSCSDSVVCVEWWRVCGGGGGCGGQWAGRGWALAEVVRSVARPSLQPTSHSFVHYHSRRASRAARLESIRTGAKEHAPWGLVKRHPTSRVVPCSSRQWVTAAPTRPPGSP